MARINIEDCWWSDARRTELLLKVGFAADAAAVNMWRAAQEFWGKGRTLIPYDVFMKLQYAQDLINAGLADVRDRSVYVRGSSEYLDWHAQRREQAAAAGRKSAQSRKEKSGTAQPAGGKGAKKTEREPNDIRTNLNGSDPSDSGSDSGSISSSEEREREDAREAPSPELKPVRSEGQPGGQWTLDAVKLSVPILMREDWRKRYPDEAWVNSELEACWQHFTLVPGETPRSSGKWAQKLNAWLKRGWEERKAKGSSKSNLVNWARVLAKQGGAR